MPEKKKKQSACVGAVEHWNPSSISCCWLTFFDRLSGKIVGLHSSWKQNVQVSSCVQPPLSTTTSVSTSTTATFTASAQPLENLSANYQFKQVTNVNTSTSGQNLNPVSDRNDPVFPEQAIASGREIGLDEDNDLLTSVRQTSDAGK